MKKLLLFVLLASISFGYAQNLSLPQLMSLRTMDLDDAELFLTQKGWSYSKGEAPSEEKFGVLQFVYNSTGDFDFGEAFIWKIYSYDGINILKAQIGKQSKYLEYLTAVKNYKPELIFSGTEDDELVKVYRGATTTFKFSTSTAENTYGDDKAVWFLRIYSNEDF